MFRTSFLRRARRTSWALALLPAAALTGCGERTPPDPTVWTGVAMDGTPEMPDVSLPGVDGEPVHLPTLTRGRVSLIFIGYTYCPDICPVHLANLGTILRDLPIEDADQVTTVFVTADPYRDTSERLESWLSSLHRDFVGLRGTRDEVNALEEALELPLSVASEPGTPEDEYVVAHASQILVFDREGRARAAYPWGVRQQDWKRDLPRMIAGEWPPLEES